MKAIHLVFLCLILTACESSATVASTRTPTTGFTPTLKPSPTSAKTITLPATSPPVTTLEARVPEVEAKLTATLSATPAPVTTPEATGAALPTPPSRSPSPDQSPVPTLTPAIALEKPPTPHGEDLLTRYDITGTFDLDSQHGWLYVDQPQTGLIVLDAQTGRRRTAVPLPTARNIAQQNNPAPLADPAVSQVLAFRDNVVYVVDPSQGVVDTIPFDIPKGDDCRSLTDPLPIIWARLDKVQRLLYLDFVTYQCTPWIGESMVAYDLNTKTIIDQKGVSQPSGLAAVGGYLYGGGWYRMGDGFRWAWRPGESWVISSGWASNSSGLIVDTTRNRVYETVDDTLRVYDPKTMTLLLNLRRPVEESLVGYDPQTDLLLFARGRSWPAKSIQPPSPEPLVSSDPPDKSVTSLVVSPAWPQDQTLFGLWNYDLMRESCYVFGMLGGLLYLSHDGGRQWGQPQAGLWGSCQRVSALAVSPQYASDQTIFAGVVGLGLFKSTDGGKLWLPSGTDIPDINISNILVSPGFEDDGIIFAQDASKHVLYRSTDKGATWQSLNVTYSPIAMSPEFEQDHTLLGVKEGEVFRSQDGGNTWQPIGAVPAGDFFVQLSLAPLFSKWQVAMAYGNRGRLYRSADGGRTWQTTLEVKPGFSPPLVQIVYAPGSEEHRQVFLNLFFYNYSDSPPQQGLLFRSADGGITWQSIALPIPTSPTAVAISPNFAQDNILFVGTAAGKVVTADAATLVEE